MSSLFRELGFLARRELAVFLDHESPRGADWKGLADKMKFTYAAILSLKGKSSPTLALLEKWEVTAGVDANLNNLISLVESLGCQEGVDILKKEKARKVDYIDIPRSIGAGVHDLSPKPHCPLTPNSSIDPSQIDPEEISRIQQVQVTSGIDPSQLAEGLETISISEGRNSSRDSVSNLIEDWVQVQSPSPQSGQTNSQTNNTNEISLNQQYDVFLSFAEEDERFAEEVRQRLVENTKAKVFVPSSGLTEGQVFHQEVADMIREGCSRTVVILSQDYLESPWCGYEANLALMRSPDASANTTLPIMYKQCEVPSFLSHLYYLDYPRFSDNREDCEEYFWSRLYKAVTFKLKR